MNSINISQKAKNKHLNFSHYEFIINSLIQFNASHPGKRNIGKTQFIRELASTVGTTVPNVYSIIKDATITIKDTYLKIHYELSAMAAFEKRSKIHKIPNNSILYLRNNTIHCMNLYASILYSSLDCEIFYIHRAFHLHNLVINHDSCILFKQHLTIIIIFS